MELSFSLLKIFDFVIEYSVKLVIKNSNSLCAIYLTILDKILVREVVLNFYIYKELFSLTNLTFKIFYAFVLD